MNINSNMPNYIAVAIPNKALNHTLHAWQFSFAKVYDKVSCGLILRYASQ